MTKQQREMSSGDSAGNDGWRDRLALYNRVRDTYREQRGGTLIPLQYVGSYADLLTATSTGTRSHEYTLDLRNFDDAEINRVVEQFHDRWLTWTVLLRRAVDPERRGDLPASAEVECDYLLRYFLSELDYQPADRADAVRGVSEKLNPVNAVLAERLVNGIECTLV